MGHDDSLQSRIARLSERNRALPDAAIAAELLALRLEAGRELCAHADAAPAPRAAGMRSDWSQGVLPEIAGSDLDADALADGLLNHGALLVRGLYSAEQLARLQRLADDTAESPAEVPLGCTATVLFELMEVYRACGLLAAIGPYLANQPVIFAERTKLRRLLADRDRFAAIPWHQDVSFYRRKCFAVNCWAAITPCGTENPGLGVIPRRLEQGYGWDGDGQAPLDYGKRMPPGLLEELSRDHPPAYPVFQPGDALLFDEMTMHTTATRRWQRPDQVVTISWFFRASAFPAWGTPLAVC